MQGRPFTRLWRAGPTSGRLKRPKRTAPYPKALPGVEIKLDGRRSLRRPRLRSLRDLPLQGALICAEDEEKARAGGKIHDPRSMNGGQTPFIRRPLVCRIYTVAIQMMLIDLWGEYHGVAVRFVHGSREVGGRSGQGAGVHQPLGDQYHENQEARHPVCHAALQHPWAVGEQQTFDGSFLVRFLRFVREVVSQQGLVLPEAGAPAAS